jgi:hypothetical protein
MKRIERRSDRGWNIINTGASGYNTSLTPGASPFNNNIPGPDIKCRDCKERNYLFPRKDDPNSLLCTNCGGITPIIIEHPTDKDTITTVGNEFQDTHKQMVFQSKDLVRGRDGKPSSMLRSRTRIMLKDMYSLWDFKF